MNANVQCQNIRFRAHEKLRCVIRSEDNTDDTSEIARMVCTLNVTCLNVHIKFHDKSLVRKSTVKSTLTV